MTASEERSHRIPRATYRLQLHAGFTFADVRRLLPYLNALGFSDVYLSPILAATPGSTHGYDVVDPTTISPVLGGSREFRRLAADVRARGMGILLDIVPNHLGIAGEANRWWFDVLRHGEASRYAPFFDINWAPADPALHGRVVLPVLAADIEDVLRRGELTLEHDADGLHLRYFDRRFPVDPATASGLDAREIEAINEARTTPEGGERIVALLDAQHYALAYWRTGSHDVNYRRFFAIDTLAGVRVEDERVFDTTHRTVLRLVKDGDVTGLRIDHIDGLADPEEYLERLHERAGTYVVVEKILAFDEELPRTWKADGTTGYEFMNDVAGLLVASENVPRFDEIYRTFTGREEPFADIAYRSQRAVVDGPLARQVDSAATELHATAARTEAGTVPLDEWIEATRALLACLPVYRLYTTGRGHDPEARRLLSVAVRDARERLPDLPDQALEAVAQAIAAPSSGDATRAVMRLQQLMPAIQAKGVEDAAIYRHVPLLTLDEVGSDPERPGLSIAEFHERAGRRNEGWPGNLLSTATHDHKRGEDVRTRLAALSSMPEEWAQTIEDWSAVTNDHLPSPPGPDSPSRHDEYAVFQTILGVWPTEGAVAADRDHLVERLTEYVVKAMREAGERTNWLDPDEAYEAALAELVQAAAHPAVAGPILEAAGSLGRRAAWLGALNSLVQVLLKLTAPGVPDTYQGTELWDLSLVDPDNRRAVDYAERAAILERLAPSLEESPEGAKRRAALVPELLREWRDGSVKQFVVARLLGIRRRNADLFATGHYRPLRIVGDHATDAIAFERRSRDASLIAVAAVRSASVLSPEALALEAWEPSWGATAVELPGAVSEQGYVDVLSGRPVPAASGVINLADVLGALPVALIEPAKSPALR